jgi:hypothetical protein
MKVGDVVMIAPRSHTLVPSPWRILGVGVIIDTGLVALTTTYEVQWHGSGRRIASYYRSELILACSALRELYAV